MSENNGHKEAMLDRHRPVSYDVAGPHGRSALARLIRREIARAEGATT